MTMLLLSPQSALEVTFTLHSHHRVTKPMHDRTAASVCAHRPEPDRDKTRGLNPQHQTAIRLLSLAEHVVRWEDDVSGAELAMFASLYAQVIEQARRELADSAHNDTSTLAERATGTAEPPAEDARSALLRLRLESCRWVRELARAQRAARAARKPRHPWRASLGLAVLLALAGLVPGAHDALVDRFDLGNISQGKRFRASSVYNASVALVGTLGDFAAPFFFHTAQERSPWVEVDLGATVMVGSITLVNRQDCCANRAVPLLVEISGDHQAWRSAATRRRNFSVWRPRLNTQARWIRLRVLRESALHLKAVIVRS